MEEQSPVKKIPRKMVTISKKYEQTQNFLSRLCSLRSFHKNNKLNPNSTNKPKNFRVDSARFVRSVKIVFLGTIFPGAIFPRTIKLRLERYANAVVLVTNLLAMNIVLLKHSVQHALNDKQFFRIFPGIFYPGTIFPGTIELRLKRHASAVVVVTNQFAMNIVFLKHSVQHAINNKQLFCYKIYVIMNLFLCK